MCFKALYDKWLPTHKAGKSTMDCYKAAIKYFEPVWFSRMQDIDIDDLQECLDDCGKGKRTQQNMKAVCGLVYKYGIPRQAVPDNMIFACVTDGIKKRNPFRKISDVLRRNDLWHILHEKYLRKFIYFSQKSFNFP